MKKTESVLLTVVFIALALWFFNIPFAKSILAISGSSLACIYFFSSFEFIIRPLEFLTLPYLKIENKILNRFLVVPIIIGCIAVVYTLLNNPFTATLRTVTLLTSVVSILVMAYLHIKKSDIDLKPFWIRILIVLGFVLSLNFIPEIVFIRKNHQEHIEYLEACEEYFADPENDELYDEMKYQELLLHHPEDEAKEILKKRDLKNYK